MKTYIFCTSLAVSLLIAACHKNDSKLNAADDGKQYSSFAAGEYINCAFPSGSQQIVCSGNDASVEDLAKVPEGSYTKFSLAPYHACAIQSSGELKCWGKGSPELLTPPAGSFAEVSSSPYLNCAIDLEGAIKCWGTDAGTLNIPAGKYHQLALGTTRVCALDQTNAAFCWGNFDEYSEKKTPDFQKLVARGDITCGLTTARGSIRCWGDGMGGIRIPSGEFYSDISVGDSFVCGLSADGTAICSTSMGSEYAARVPDTKFVAISSGSTHSCGLTAEGSVSCWGLNYANLLEAAEPAQN